MEEPAVRRLRYLLAVCLVVHATWPVLQATAQQAATSKSTQSGSEGLDTQQLDALLAPIARYPDTLLTQVPMASTFPLEVVEAQRWLDDPAHKSLKGDELTKALQPLSWDP